MPDAGRPPRVRRLGGERIRLRRFRSTDEPAVWAGRLAADPSASPRGPGHRTRLRERLLASGDFHRGSLDLAIEAGRRLIGDIQARQGIGQHLPPGVVELGIQLYSPQARGKGYGSEAIRLLTGWLFEHGVAERVQASTATHNTAMRRVFDKLGFTCEGTMRAFMPVGDHREDFVLYAVTRQEWGKQGDRPS